MNDHDVKVAREFAKKVDALGIPKVSPSDVMVALGMTKDELTTTQTLFSFDTVRDIHKGGSGFEGMASLFNLALTLGIAYGMRVAKCDKLHAGEF